MPVQPELVLTKDNILKYVTQEQIFEAYLGLPVEVGLSYINPLRLDKNPGCKYYYNSIGKLYFKDFGRFHWDCFAVVQYINNNCSFTEALRIIARDFQLTGLTPTNNKVQYVPPPKTRQVIKVTTREWEIKDIEYWKQFNISLEILKKFNVYPCKAVWFNNQYYRCQKDDPCYCYYFGRDLYKLYFPFRKKGHNKFVQNFTVDDDMLQGIHQLPNSGDHCVITKSYKDVMSLYSFGITSVSVHSENHIIKESLYEDISRNFMFIISLFDKDTTGRSLAIKYFRQYKIPYLIFPRSYEKDFSDNVRILGNDGIIRIIENVKEKYGIHHRTQT